MRNELFDPVLSVLRFKDEEEAIRLKRDSDYAFAGGTFSRDFGKANRTARAITIERFWIDTDRRTGHAMPSGGSRNSRYGREGAIETNHYCTKIKRIFADPSGVAVSHLLVMR